MNNTRRHLHTGTVIFKYIFILDVSFDLNIDMAKGQSIHMIAPIGQIDESRLIFK